MFTGEPTLKLRLPQWNPTDHPDFLTDINQAFKDIDNNAGMTAEEIKDMPKQIDDLQTLTQSLNEDTQQMIGEIGAINVALGNLRKETDKVEPIEQQVLGLQAIARRQSDAIREIDSRMSIEVPNEDRYPISTTSGITGELTVYRYGSILHFNFFISGEVPAGYQGFFVPPETWKTIQSNLGIRVERLEMVFFDNRHNGGEYRGTCYIEWRVADSTPKVVLNMVNSNNFPEGTLFGPTTFIIWKGLNENDD